MVGCFGKKGLAHLKVDSLTFPTMYCMMGFSAGCRKRFSLKNSSLVLSKGD